MKRFYKKAKVVVIIITMLIGVILTKDCVQATDNIPVIQPPDNIQSIRKSDTSIRVKWKTVPNADGYIIYRRKPSSKKYVKVHTVACSAAGIKKQWLDKKLKKNKVYKYKIASYKNENGRKKVSNLSDWVSAKTYERGKKKINARAPKLSSKSVNLGLRSSKKINSYVPVAKYGKNKEKTPFSKTVRWYSSDSSVATVTARGVIAAGVKPGTCYVYAKAHNGLKTKVKVTVKNYARVKEYYGQYLQEDDIYLLVTQYRTSMQNIAEYYSINRLPRGKTIEFRLNDEAEIVVTPANADLGNLRKDLETLLVDFPYFIDINVSAGSVEYVLRKQDDTKAVPGYVRFYFDNDCSEWLYQAASHWQIKRRAGI